MNQATARRTAARKSREKQTAQAWAYEKWLRSIDNDNARLLSMQTRTYKAGE